MIHESFFIVSNVCFLSLNSALHHQVCITFLAGHPIFNSMPENIFPYFFWISAKHFNNIFSSDQNICAITGDWSLSVNKCLITHGGLIIYPSAFINSVHNHSSYFFSPYTSKISFTIWRKAQSVYPSMGASQSIMVHTVRKLKKISREKLLFFLSPRRLGVSFWLPGSKRNQKTPRRLPPSSLFYIDTLWYDFFIQRYCNRPF